MTPRALRYALIAVHYRAPLEFSDDPSRRPRRRSSGSPRRTQRSMAIARTARTTRSCAALETMRARVRCGAGRRPEHLGGAGGRLRRCASSTGGSMRDVVDRRCGRALAAIRVLDQVLGWQRRSTSARAGGRRLLDGAVAARAAATGRVRSAPGRAGGAEGSLVEDTRTASAGDGMEATMADGTTARAGHRPGGRAIATRPVGRPPAARHRPAKRRGRRRWRTGRPGVRVDRLAAGQPSSGAGSGAGRAGRGPSGASGGRRAIAGAPVVTGAAAGPVAVAATVRRPAGRGDRAR